MSAVTVVIPTFNRAGLLKKALHAYGLQSPPGLIKELIVVDDGSSDSTKRVVEEASQSCGFEVRYLRQDNKGPAAARNQGIREARAEIILFTDDDVVPNHDLVFQHVEWHKERPEDSVVVLGFVTWPTEPQPTPFMKWYGRDGQLFSYGRFRHASQLSYMHLYTCNASMKVAFLRDCGLFDEDFKSAAYEDTELAYRLAKSGMRLYFNRGAVGYHYQFFSFRDACRKARSNAAAAKIFLSKEAGQSVLAPRLKRRNSLWFRGTALAAKGVAVALRPAIMLVDSMVPMPSAVYRLLFWEQTTNLFESPSGTSKKQKEMTLS
jgi:GT2 family glycosyltransferase